VIYISAYAMFCATQDREPFPNGCRCFSSRRRSGELGVDQREGSNFEGEGKIVGDIEMKRFDIPMAV
jgi:hypothetical protein